MGREVFYKLRQVVAPLFGAAALAYFGYHALQGNRGLIAWWNLRYELERADRTLAQVTAEKTAIQQRVQLLRPESLDRDMLEERARIMLGATAAGDLIVPNP